MERLGKSLDFISEGHSSFMAGVREHYISFKEIIQPWNNELIYEQVAEGLHERYGGSDYNARQAHKSSDDAGERIPAIPPHLVGGRYSSSI
jgi:hypothetical protein